RVHAFMVVSAQNHMERLSLAALFFKSSALVSEVEGDQVEIRFGCDEGMGIECLTLVSTAVPDRLLPACGLDEDSAHGLGGGRGEVPAAVDPRLALPADQAEVGLVNEGGRLKRLTWLLVGQACGGEFP